jgi:hypothetical protein
MPLPRTHPCPCPSDAPLAACLPFARFEKLDAEKQARLLAEEPEALMRHMALVLDSIWRLLTPVSELGWKPSFLGR